MKLIYLFFIIYIGATVNLVNAEEISQPINNDACRLGQNESGTNIGIGQSFIVDKEDRISKFIMYFLPLNFEGNRAADLIICDLRNSEGEVLETSSLKGDDCMKRAEATFNFTEHKNGTYIITCYLHNSKESEYHEYLVYTNKNGSSYTDGTRYVSTGVDPKKWSAWKEEEGDLTFKIPIIAERASSNKPSQSTRDSNNSSIAESAIDKSMPTDIEKPSLKETWVGAIKENIWIITIIFFVIMLTYGPGYIDRVDKIFKTYGYFKNKTRKSEDTEENTVPHLSYLESEIYDLFKSVYQKEREEGVSEVNSKTLELLKHKLLDLTASGKEIKWLDVGCGDGRCLEVLDAIQNRKKIRYHGIDSLHRYIDDAEERARGFGIIATFDKTNAAVMDFDSEYDVVSAVLLLHEVDPLCLPYVLRNMLRALKNGETLVISDFQGPYEQECDVVAWNVDDITHLLEKIGVTWIKTEFIQSKQGTV
jgi:SAM-dependent methyltransferase